MKRSTERNIIWKRIEDASTIFIYGAQVVAYGVYVAIREVLGKEPEAFIVSSKDNNPTKIEDISVVEVNRNIQSNALVIVATPEVYHKSINDNLKQCNLDNVLFVDTHVEYLIMSRYFKKAGRFMLLEDTPLLDKDTNDYVGVKMYMAKHYKDPVLKGKYDIPSWIQPIQVGAALVEERIADLLDSTGNNISYKNYKYSELTAMYWAWKNSKEDYLGICHYRRMLLLSKDDIRKIKENNINVVLPLPFVCYPDTSGQYGRYISVEDQQKMLDSLKELSPDYYSKAQRLLREPYLYNYNMFLADANTFKDYCHWIFPILERAEELCEPEGHERRDRYIGYFGEVLTAVYFLYNKSNLKIVHAEKKWMV